MNSARPIGSGDEALTATELLTLERVGETRFRSWRNQDNRIGSLFGGQPLGQALAAAQATVADDAADSAVVHSMAGNFMRSGNVDIPVDYDVEMLRDGRRYATRRVLASQDGQAIFDCICSFHKPEEGVAHQVAQVDAVTDPETLQRLSDLAGDPKGPVAGVMRRSFTLPFPVELRLVDAGTAFGTEPTSSRDLWFRVPSAGELTDPKAHLCMLAFASDYWLAAAAAMPHRVTRDVGLAITSLNHAMWFHAPVRADEWLLYRTSSPWAAHGRGLSHGQIFDRTGRLVASVSQESSMRPIARKRD